MGKFWRVCGVLALNVTVEVPVPKDGGLGINFPGPLLAILVYGLLVLATLSKSLNHLPGVFALRRPLGVVRSGYEYLWLPAIAGVLLGFTYTGSIEGREWDSRFWTLIYGASHEAWPALVAFGAFILMMWSLKFHACMIESNRRLAQD